MYPITWTVFCFIFLGHMDGAYNDGIITLAQQVRSLQNELRQLKLDFPRLEDKLHSDRTISELILRDDLKNDIVPMLVASQVRVFMASLFKDKSLESMISSQVTAEIKDLKMRYYLLKIQNQHMSREMGHLRRKTSVYEARSKKSFPGTSEQLERKLNHFMDELNDTISTIEELKERNADLEAKYNELLDENDMLECDLRLNIEDHERSVKNTSENIVSFVRREISAWESNNTKICCRKDEGLELQVENLFDALNETVDKVEELAGRNSELKVKFNQLRGEKAALRRILLRKFDGNKRSIRKIAFRVDNFVGKTKPTWQLTDAKSPAEENEQLQLHMEKIEVALNDTLGKVEELRADNSELNIKFNKFGDANGISERNVRLKLEVNERSMVYISSKVARIQRDATDTRDRLEALEGTSLNLKFKHSEVNKLVLVERKLDEMEGKHAVLTSKLKQLSQTQETDKMTMRNVTSEITKHVQANRDMVDQLNYGITYYLRQNMSRLLITPYASESQQVSLHDGQLSPFPQLDRPFITELAYDPLRETILFSTYKPPAVYSLTLDGHHLVTLLTDMFANWMAIDGRQLFIVAHTLNNSLCMLNTDSKNFKTLTQLKDTVSGMTLDAKKKILYLATYKNLMAMNYEGHILKILYSGTYILGVALDLDKQNLYFSTRRTVMRRSLSHGSSVVIMRLSKSVSRIRDLRYYNKTVYMSSPHDGNVYAFDTNTNIRKKMVTVAVDSSICLLP